MNFLLRMCTENVTKQSYYKWTGTNAFKSYNVFLLLYIYDNAKMRENLIC